MPRANYDQGFTTAVPNAAYAPVGSSTLPGAVWYGSQHGLLYDGTDESTAFLALVTAVMAAGGGEIRLEKLCRVDSQITLPNTANGNNPRTQAPLRISGSVANIPGETTTYDLYPTGGLDLRYAGRTDASCGTTLGSCIVTDASAAAGDIGRYVIGTGIPDRAAILAVNPGVGYTLDKAARATGTVSLTVFGGKIQGFGLGVLDLDHLLLVDGGTSSVPFVLSTNTTVRAEKCAILGGSTKSGATCDQDPFVFGGNGVGTALTSQLTSGNSYTSLAVLASPAPIASGATVVINQGASTTQTVTLSAPVAIGDTTISVNSFTANATYATWTGVAYLGSGGANPGVTPASPFQGYGTRIRGSLFDRVRRILVQGFVSDVDIDANEWWQNCGSNLAAVPSTLTAQLTAATPYTSISVSALSRAVLSGDTLQIGVGLTAVTVTASANAAVGATSVSISSFTPTTTMATSTVVFDITAGIGAMVESFAFAGGANVLTVTKNRMELSSGYNYCGRFSGTSQESTIAFNGPQDSHAENIALWRFDAGANSNLVLHNAIGTTIPLLDDQATPGSVTQTVIGVQQGHASYFPRGLFTNGAISGFTSDATGAWTPGLYDPAGNYWQWRTDSSNNTITLQRTTAAGVVTSFVTFDRSTNTLSLVAALSTLLATNGTLQLQSKADSEMRLGDPTLPADTKIRNGVLELTHFIGFAAVPTIAAASSSTSLSIVGKDIAHKVTFTTAAGLSADAAVATITYGKAWGAQAPGSHPRIAITPKDGASAAAQAFISSSSDTAYSIGLHNPAAGATALSFDVQVIGSPD